MRAHIKAEHGGFSEDQLTRLEEPGYHSIWLMHHSMHSNHSNRPVNDHWHGGEDDEPDVTDFMALAWEINEAHTDYALATIATNKATQDAINRGALSDPLILDALTQAYGAGLRTDLLLTDITERIHGAEYDPDALYGSTDAEMTADRLKDRIFHEQQALPVELPEMTNDEMREMIALNQHLLNELARAAMHDSLTGLANRRLFSEQLTAQLARSKRNGERVAVMFVDLDYFKTVNDTHGHDVGDALLVEVAQRLEESVRAGDVVARIGGDEFVLMLSDVRDAETAFDVARKIQSHLVAPTMIDGHELTIEASIGLAYSRPDDTEPTLVKRADSALYVAKENGRNTIEMEQS